MGRLRSPRERDGEARALAVITIRANIAAEQPGQAAAEVQAQPAALVAPACRAAHLPEGLEQQRHALGLDANAGVANADFNPVVAATAGDGHAAVVRELDGVIE